MGLEPFYVFETSIEVIPGCIAVSEQDEDEISRTGAEVLIDGGRKRNWQRQAIMLSMSSDYLAKTCLDVHR